LERIDKRDNIGYDAQRLAGTLRDLSGARTKTNSIIQI
jgi:hypothetical protein